MSQIKITRGSGSLKEATPKYALVVRDASEPAMSRIQILRDSPSFKVESILPPGVLSLVHRQKVEQKEELDRIYGLMKEELGDVVSGMDTVLVDLRETVTEETIEEVQKRGLDYSGSFKGVFEGDGRKLKNLRWENIIGKRIRQGAGGATFPTALITASFAVSSSFAETASFAQNAATASFVDPLPSASLASGSLVPGRGIEITVSGSTQIIESDKESFVTFLDTQPGLLILRNQVVGLEEPEPDSRKRVNLSEYRQARISVQVERAGFASASVGYQFSTDGGGTWAFLDGLSGPTASLSTTGSNTSSYVDLASSAIGDILIRWIAQGGNGFADPRISTLMLDIR